MRQKEINREFYKLALIFLSEGINLKKFIIILIKC